jgi:hypothetical protein
VTDTVSRLLRLAVRLKDVQNLLNEDISVSPHHYPGILTQTMGGPAAKRKIHQKHDMQGPRGIAEAEDEEETEEDE